MKKVLILCSILLLFSGCGKKESEYELLVTDLKNQTTFEEVYPFQVEIDLEPITEEEWLYQVIIDEVEEPMEKVRVIAIHDYPTNDIFPSVGFFDDPVELGTDEKKGIALVGYLQNYEETKITFRIRMIYEKNGKEEIVDLIRSIDK